MEEARLDELDREEFWEVFRRVAPHLTREAFDRHWECFQRRKAEGQFKGPPQ